MPTTSVYCDCKSFDCAKSIELTISVALEITQKGYYVIVDGCRHGPAKGDKLIEKRDGYAFYQES